ncbi:protein kinase [Nonomuraea sp. M3C6]|uniref:non-specific serine/threonine protein kinase n=1 Tax=Nonomuraea marmarensis TaxID=3351344 RepID=A0ABW7A427_9ACTN
MPNVEPLREGDPAAVGPYRLVGRLGAGGHGVVYLGQARNGVPVAVKVLREGLAVGDRLAKEIAAARKVEPFCLARVLGASTSGRPYIVAEYVDGPSLQQAGRHGTDPQRLAVSTATALDAIHQAGVVHGDFKPANVLLGPDGPQVVDFGIAGALGSGMKATSNIVGTPAYMAPEQLAGKAVGAPADVFAWASVVVFAATGVPPFGDDALPVVINRILNDEPQIGELRSPLREVVLACLAKEPATRPTMRDVLLRLTAPLRQRSAPHQTPDQPPAWHQTPEHTPEPPAWDRTPDHTAEPPAWHQTPDPAEPSAWQQTLDQDPAHDPSPGRPHDPALGRSPDPMPGRPHDPASGRPLDPALGRSHDPVAGRSRAQATGRPHAASGKAEGPRQGAPRAAARHPAPASHHGSAHLASPHPTPDSHESPAQSTSPLQALFELSAPVEPPPSQFEQPAPFEPPVSVEVPAEAPAPARRSGRRRVKTVIIAGVAGVSVLALAAAIVWLTPTTPTPKTRNVAVVTNAPTTSPAATPTRAQRPKRTRTARPTPQSDGTPSSVPTATSTAATTGRLRLVYLRAGGARNGDCWAGGEVTLQALVQRTGSPVNFSYTWLIDGVTAGRASAIISENGQRYLTSPRNLKSVGGTHNVTLRITSPIALQRTITVTICERTTF